MEQTIDEEFGEWVERKTDEPEHILFTHIELPRLKP